MLLDHTLLERKWANGSQKSDTKGEGENEGGGEGEADVDNIDVDSAVDNIDVDSAVDKPDDLDLLANFNSNWWSQQLRRNMRTGSSQHDDSNARACKQAVSTPPSEEACEKTCNKACDETYDGAEIGSALTCTGLVNAGGAILFDYRTFHRYCQYRM
jgi:hypothetical protein